MNATSFCDFLKKYIKKIGSVKYGNDVAFRKCRLLQSSLKVIRSICFYIPDVFCVGDLQRTIDYSLPTVAGLFQKGIEPITNVFHRSLVFIMFGENKSNCTAAKDIHPALICCAVMTDALLEEDTHNY